MDCYWAGIGITTQQEQAGLDGNYSARRTLLAKIFVNIAHTEILWQSLESGTWVPQFHYDHGVLQTS